MRAGSSRPIAAATLLFVFVTMMSSAERPVTAKPTAGSAAPVIIESEQSAGTSPGSLSIRIRDVLGRPLASQVDLHPSGQSAPTTIPTPEGRADGIYPVGTYQAYVRVYDLGVPVLVAVREVELGMEPCRLEVELLEGASGNKQLLEFDQDFDLALDRVELEVGTDPNNANSIPGQAALHFASPVLSSKAGWYRGELHAHSKYGEGRESVKELVARAEKTGLDFLAITDLDTLAAASDPEFKSKRVVLIPAMEWGDKSRGLALIYGPGTVPQRADSFAGAQAVANLVQAQGGVFAIAHPCFSTAPWQWGVSYVNAIEVWCRDWRDVPPLSLKSLNKAYQTRRDGKLIHSIALAAATPELSANGQAALFWDYESARGLKACPIAGSNTASKDVPMGEPVTYVYAPEKSVRGILAGLQRGWTYVSKGLDAPQLTFTADVMKNNLVDVPMGGLIPLGVEVVFEVGVKDAKDHKVQVLRDGYPIISKKIDSNDFMLRIAQTPDSYSVYRVRVVTTPAKKGFGHVEVLAMSSPIYAQELVVVDPKLGPQQMWVKLQKQKQPALPDLPPDPGAVREIIPTWQY
ncbi:MAG: CehA/McbA family metallohydrolase [Candidatus Hydrogenedentes bacterium]|nr:CehA/McbA family metallohydrolase [Candidatus Hydrogenedentota bacterium]